MTMMMGIVSERTKTVSLLERKDQEIRRPMQPIRIHEKTTQTASTQERVGSVQGKDMKKRSNQK
jgi:hypothetical protein